jgi:hypothetical protein
MKISREATKDTLLTAYVNHVIDSMTLEEIREELKEFVYDDMHPLPKREILEYIDAICPEIIAEKS